MLGVLLPSSRRVDGVAAFSRASDREGSVDIASTACDCRGRGDGTYTYVLGRPPHHAIEQTRHHQNNAIRTGKEVVRTRMEQLQALEDAQDAAESAKKPVPEPVSEEGGGRGPAADQGARPRPAVRGVPLRGARFVCGVPPFVSCPIVRRRRHDDAGMEPTYAHTCVKGIKLAAGELSDSTEEEEVEAMEMYARLAEAEDPRDFEQTLQEARKRALAEENEIQQSIETLEELAREHVNDSLAVMEYRYELRQMSKFGFLSGLISAPRAHVERNVAKAVLQGSPKNLRTALMVLSTFPPVRYSVSP